MSVQQSIFHNSSQGEVSEPTGKNNSIVFDFPTADAPLICKFVKEPFSGSFQSCVKIDYFKHMVGNSDQDTRMHPCRDSLGLGRSPEKDYHWELVAKLKDLKEAGKKDTPEYKAVVDTMKFFKPSTRGYIYFVEPNSPKIRALKVGPMFFNRLFGRAKTEWRGEIPSLVKQMALEGLNPFLDVDPKVNQTGWVKIWKTGEKLATEYHIEVCTVETWEEVRGKNVKVTELKEFEVHPELQAVIKGEKPLDVNNIPNVVEYEIKQAWTEDECQTLVDAEGSIAGTPERFLKGNDKDSPDGEVNSDNYGSSMADATVIGADVATASNSASEAPNLDDIPF